MAYGVILGQKPIIPSPVDEVTQDNMSAVTSNAVWQAINNLPQGVQLQFASYVGNGQYGLIHPCVIIASFPIKFILFLGQKSSSNRWNGSLASNSASVDRLPASALSTSYTESYGFGINQNGYLAGKISSDKKIISWYHSSDPSYQLNQNGMTYYFAIFG